MLLRFLFWISFLSYLLSTILFAKPSIQTIFTKFRIWIPHKRLWHRIGKIRWIDPFTIFSKCTALSPVAIVKFIYTTIDICTATSKTCCVYAFRKTCWNARSITIADYTANCWSINRPTYNTIWYICFFIATACYYSCIPKYPPPPVNDLENILMLYCTNCKTFVLMIIKF